jgi:eukaryotic-like serine/threonine-protein kinase
MHQRDRLIGQVINNFEIQDVIGRGGMGIVYRAYHPDLQRYSAIKVMRPELANQKGFYERFLQEARTAARLEHPNIVNVINFGRFENSYYLMMDYIEGPSLRQLMIEKKGPLPMWDVAQVFWQIADVLVYSHVAGVLHRDLKPDNILLTHSIRPNRPYRAIVTDFGLVKLVQNSILETQEGISVGTPAYMSPEQCRGEDVDGRTDVYALGVMLYEAVTGQRPYPIRSLFDAARFHASGKLIAPRALNPALPAQMDSLIRRMLITDKERRLPSAAEATDELQEMIMLLDRDVGQRPASELQERIASSQQAMAIPTPGEGRSTPTITPPHSATAQFYVQIAYQEQWHDTMHPLGDKPVHVGRLQSADIVLDRPERYISKRHCEIVVEGGRVLIRDLASTNGTILDQEKLPANVFHDWQPGVLVHLGPFVLALRTAEELNNLPSPASNASQPPPTTKVHFSMKLFCPNAVPSRLPLLGDRPVVIGRSIDCDMVLDHPHVSKNHCRIQLTDNGPEIVDLRSTNGTYLRGQRLPAHVPIPWKDELTITVGPFTVALEDKSSSIAGIE